MASSKNKGPPVLRRKTKAANSADKDSSADDSTLSNAFKRLKMELDWTPVQQHPEPSRTATKTPDAKNDGDGEQPQGSNEDWTQPLLNFCFCDRKAIKKDGRVKLQSMCHYHRSRIRRNNAISKSSLNFSQAVLAYRPLVWESRLKFKMEEKQKPESILHSSHFSLKESVKDEKETDCGKIKNNNLSNSEAAKKTTVIADVLASDTKSMLSKNSLKSCVPKTEESPGKMFAASTSENLSSFSSLLSEAVGESRPSVGLEPAPVFDGYRAVSCPPPSCNAPIPSMKTSTFASESSSTRAVINPSVMAAPRGVERTCSQEARLDESELNVTELAAYFDNFLHLPKDMSSMAQMMYI